VLFGIFHNLVNGFANIDPDIFEKVYIEINTLLQSNKYNCYFWVKNNVLKNFIGKSQRKSKTTHLPN